VVVEEESDIRAGVAADSMMAKTDLGILRMAHQAVLVGTTTTMVEGTVAEVGLVLRVVGINVKAVGTTTGTRSECVIERAFDAHNSSLLLLLLIIGDLLDQIRLLRMTRFGFRGGTRQE